MCKGLTTHEDCKYVFDSGQASPFTRFSYFANLKRTIFKKLSQNLFNPKLMYEELKKEKVMIPVERPPEQSDKRSDNPDTGENNVVDENQIQIAIDDKKEVNN